LFHPFQLSGSQHLIVLPKSGIEDVIQYDVIITPHVKSIVGGTKIQTVGLLTLMVVVVDFGMIVVANDWIDWIAQLFKVFLVTAISFGVVPNHVTQHDSSHGHAFIYVFVPIGFQFGE